MSILNIMGKIEAAQYNNEDRSSRPNDFLRILNEISSGAIDAKSISVNLQKAVDKFEQEMLNFSASALEGHDPQAQSNKRKLFLVPDGILKRIALFQPIPTQASGSSQGPTLTQESASQDTVSVSPSQS